MPERRTMLGTLVGGLVGLAITAVPGPALGALGPPTPETPPEAVAVAVPGGEALDGWEWDESFDIERVAPVIVGRKWTCRVGAMGRWLVQTGDREPEEALWERAQQYAARLDKALGIAYDFDLVVLADAPLLGFEPPSYAESPVVLYGERLGKFSMIAVEGLLGSVDDSFLRYCLAKVTAQLPRRLPPNALMVAVDDLPDEPTNDSPPAAA